MAGLGGVRFFLFRFFLFLFSGGVLLLLIDFGSVSSLSFPLATEGTTDFFCFNYVVVYACLLKDLIGLGYTVHCLVGRTVRTYMQSA